MSAPALEQAAACLAALRRRGATLATAESLTCGLLSATLASVPGASDVLRGGVAAYATDVKTGVLGVDAGLVAAHGVVSAPCAQAMATAARTLLGADFAVSTTGVAGPGPSDGHPAGEVYVAVAAPDGEPVVRRLRLSGDRTAVREGTVSGALELLASVVSASGSG